MGSARPSPFRRLRLLAGRGHREFAEEADISLTAMTNIEQGMYVVVPVRANRVLTDSCKRAGIDAREVLRNEYGASSLNEAMDAWKTEKRRAVDLSEAGEQATLDGLIATFFDTPAKFARALAIPTGMVDGRRTGGEMPDLIREALTEAGYRHAASLR